MDLLTNLVFETKESESKLLPVVGLDSRLVNAFVPPTPSCIGWVVDFSIMPGEAESKFFVLREDIFDSRATTEGLLAEPLLLVKLVDDTKFDERRLELCAVKAEEPRLDLSELLLVNRLEVWFVLPDCINGVVEVVSCLELRRLWLLVVDRDEDFNSDPCSKDERVSREGFAELDSNCTELVVTFDLELRLLVVWVFSDDPEDSSEVV